MMFYKEFIPSKTIREYVECFWYIKIDNKNFSNFIPIIFPYGNPELIYLLGDKIRLTILDRYEKEINGAFFTGQIKEKAVIQSNGVFEAIAIRFKPYGAYPFLNIPVKLTNNNLYNMDDLDSNFNAHLYNQLHSVKTIQRKIELIDKFLVNRLNYTDPKLMLVGEMIKDIDRSNGTLSISSLPENFSLSLRSIERLFSKYVGLSPKSYARIIRFLFLLKTTTNENELMNGLNVGMNHGFYDQAHFIKEIKMLTGHTPKDFFNNRSNYFGHKLVIPS